MSHQNLMVAKIQMFLFSILHKARPIQFDGGWRMDGMNGDASHRLYNSNKCFNVSKFKSQSEWLHNDTAIRK